MYHFLRGDDARAASIRRVVHDPLKQNYHAIAKTDQEKEMAVRVLCARPATDPAISTPVGPAPTSTKVKSACRFSSSLSFSACSKAHRIWLRISVACLIDLSPGANFAQSG